MSEKQQDGMHLSDIAGSLEHYHQASMSNDPYLAVVGRLGKHIVNLIDKWVDEENARGTENVHLISAANLGAVMLFMSIVNGCTQQGKRAEAAALLRAHWISAYDTAVDHARSAGL